MGRLPIIEDFPGFASDRVPIGPGHLDRFPLQPFEQLGIEGTAGSSFHRICDHLIKFLGRISHRSQDRIGARRSFARGIHQADRALVGRAGDRAILLADGHAEHPSEGLGHGVVDRGKLTPEDAGPEHGDKVFGQVDVHGHVLRAAQD
ncbi:hypothetical protein TA3x_004000 [Tundrisphaera sp. TA3]|uniref:hypothetical protein n=1 Tax=Tundrisphaera sp. TA3 TaxID=3435775 RepID=UPI003EB7DB2E